MTETDRLLHRIRSFLAQPGVSKAGLAKRAGLHPNTLRDADSDGWNPTIATIRAVEPHLPSEFAPDQAAPSATNAGEIIAPPAQGHHHPFAATSSTIPGATTGSATTPASPSSSGADAEAEAA